MKRNMYNTNELCPVFSCDGVIRVFTLIQDNYMIVNNVCSECGHIVSDDKSLNRKMIKSKIHDLNIIKDRMFRDVIDIRKQVKELKDLM